MGISVHAAARICFSAHGGQIVMSSAVRTVLGKSLPADVTLKSLGPWRFRGLPSRSRSSGRDAGPVERLPAAAVGEASAMTEGVIAVDDPRAEDVRALIARHLAFTRATTTPEHVGVR